MARPTPRRWSAGKRATPARARGTQPPSPAAAVAPRRPAQQTGQRCARRTRGPTPSRRTGAAAAFVWTCCTPRAVRTRSARTGYPRAHSARDAAVVCHQPLPSLPGGTACAADTSPTRASGPCHLRRMRTSPQQADQRSGGWQRVASRAQPHQRRALRYATRRRCSCKRRALQPPLLQAEAGPRHTTAGPRGGPCGSGVAASPVRRRTARTGRPVGVSRSLC